MHLITKECVKAKRGKAPVVGSLSIHRMRREKLIWTRKKCARPSMLEFVLKTNFTRCLASSNKYFMTQFFTWNDNNMDKWLSSLRCVFSFSFLPPHLVVFVFVCRGERLATFINMTTTDVFLKSTRVSEREREKCKQSSFECEGELSWFSLPFSLCPTLRLRIGGIIVELGEIISFQLANTRG